MVSPITLNLNLTVLQVRKLRDELKGSDAWSDPDIAQIYHELEAFLEAIGKAHA